jgi:hypothetical protein
MGREEKRQSKELSQELRKPREEHRAEIGHENRNASKAMKQEKDETPATATRPNR